jgi:hypothetical protein
MKKSHLKAILGGWRGGELPTWRVTLTDPETLEDTETLKDLIEASYLFVTLCRGFDHGSREAHETHGECSLCFRVKRALNRLEKKAA